MTHQQALQVVAYLNAVFPRDALEDATVDVYAREIALLNDPEVALQAAEQTARYAQRFPTLQEFRATYRSLAEAARDKTPALNGPARETRVPEWVMVWWWLRNVKNDRRVLPQQDEHGFHESVSLDEYQSLRAEWVAAGEPGISGVLSMLGADAA